VDVNSFLAFKLRRMSFSIKFFEIDMLLQLKISYELTDIDVIDRF
jgi:hypothetical protein